MRHPIPSVPCAALVVVLAACQPAPRAESAAPTAAPSPATVATPAAPVATRAVCHVDTGAGCGHFRALGTEPGWLAVIALGPAPTLHAELDYGERKYDVALTAGKDGWSGQAADGSFISLSLRPGACSDGMSDRAWPASATVLAGEKRYEGCGTWEP